jgi:uncharacterized linocin/CFP29 family protein
MSDFLMREDAPLSAEEWGRLDMVVVETARQFLVGRRFVELVGPLGAGMETVPVGTGANRSQVPLQVIQADFQLVWRDVEASRKLVLPLELGPAAMAAAACARQEDEMIFGGLLEAAGKDKDAPMGDWNVEGQAFASVVTATEKLVSDNFYGPFAVVLSPALYAKTERVVQSMGRLERKLIEDVAEGGVFRSPVLGADQGLVVSLGAYNFDLAVGQDLVTAYTGNEGMDQCFRVFETLALRVKRPGAISKLIK